MAMFHVDVRAIRKGVGGGGAAGFAKYITRADWEEPAAKGLSPAEQHGQYLTRERSPQKADLVLASHTNLPAWAREDPVHFFAMAQRYERKNGIVARLYEFSLPRELNPVQREALANDIRQTLFNQHPHHFAIHCPRATDGREQPHLHVEVCERVIDGIERGPQQFFRRAATQGRSPEDGGARKEMRWNKDTSIVEVREAVATLTNAALERAGHATAVHHQRLRDQGHDRDIPTYSTGKQKVQVEERRAVIRRDYHPWENDMNLIAWHEQKAREHLDPMDRQAVLDHVRDRFWVHDESPQRDAERAASFARRLAREYARTGKDLAAVRDQLASLRQERRPQGARVQEPPGGAQRRQQTVPPPSHRREVPTRKTRDAAQDVALAAVRQRVARLQPHRPGGLALDDEMTQGVQVHLRDDDRDYSR